MATPARRCEHAGAPAILVAVKRTYLSAAEVAELADLLEDAPRRVGIVDEVLEAAAAGRGLTLTLQPVGSASRGAERPNRRRSVSGS